MQGLAAASFGMSWRIHHVMSGRPEEPPNACLSPVEEAEVPRPRNCLIPRRGPELAVDRGRFRLDGVAGQGHLLGDLGE